MYIYQLSSNHYTSYRLLSANIAIIFYLGLPTDFLTLILNINTDINTFTGTGYVNPFKDNHY